MNGLISPELAERLKASTRDRACVVGLVKQAVNSNRSYPTEQLKAVVDERETLEDGDSLVIPCNLGKCRIVLVMEDATAYPQNCPKYPDTNEI